MIVRKAAAKALEKTISCHPEFITSTIQQLKEKYEEKLYVRISHATRQQRRLSNDLCQRQIIMMYEFSM